MKKLIMASFILAPLYINLPFSAAKSFVKLNSNETKIIKQKLPSYTPADGLTLEEDRRINLPPPVNITVRIFKAWIRLEWDPPEKFNELVDIKHYNIYRGTEDEELRLLDTATNRFYEDERAGLDNHFIYAISVVYQDGREGALSDEVELEK